ncbi:MAG: ABC transporter permease [Bacteroidota bacterium]
MNKQPPKYPLKFFRWFCDPDCVEDIEGDLLERFEKRPSRWSFTMEVLKLLRPEIIKPASGKQKINYYGMFKHNILITLRNFKRFRNSFLINLVGLSSGLAAVLLIYLWVNDELNVNKFHENDDQLFEVMGNYDQGDRITTWNGMPTGLAEALKANIPEVAFAVGATDPEWRLEFVLSNEEKKLKSVGRFVDKDFFELFSYSLIEGDAQTVLQEKNAVLVSEQLAKRLFGHTDVVGEFVDWQVIDDQRQSVITGIFKAPPQNSTDQFDLLVPFGIYQENNGIDLVNPTSVAYVLLTKEANVEEVNEKIAGFIKERVPDSNVSLFLKKYSDSYLHGTYENGKLVGGRIEYVWLFSTIAFFILLIGCINFMNLSTARASRRLKEVGIKKTVGAIRSQLVFQYLSESILITLFSILIALAAVSMLLPQFNVLTQKSIQMDLSMEIIGASILIALFTGLLSGSYPAFYLSGFRPIEILKGKLKGSVGESFIRKGLVVFQFSISVILVLSVIVVNKQMEFVQNKHLGYDRDNLIFIDNNGDIKEKMDVFLDQVKTLQGVKNSSAIINDLFNPPGNMDFSWQGKTGISFNRFIVYGEFIETLGLTLKEGRSFSKAFAQDEIVINESAVRAMDLKNAIGATAKIWGREVKVVGVVKDFYFKSLHEESGPLFFHTLPPRYMARIMIRLESSNERATLEKIETIYKELSPGIPFEYRFLNERFESLYEQENRVADLANYFAIIAILISCLGLFGLTAFTVERRVKEIGIRKILGSSIFQIIVMLTKDFTKLVLLAIMIALPAGYLIVKNWLDSFAFRIDLSWQFFAITALVAMGVAWLSIGWQTTKASFINPSECLRDE